MAIQDKTYDATERDFWISKAGCPANTPFSQAKREGIMAELGGGITYPRDIGELEKLYIRTVLSSTYGKVGQSNRIPDLWLQLASAAGISIVNKPWQQAKYEFLLFNY